MKSLLVALALILACAPATNTKAGPKTLLWKVSSPQRIVYLTGDTQALAEHDYPLPAAVMQAFAVSGELMTEGDPGTPPARVHALIVKYGVQEPGGHLQQQLDAAQRKMLEQALAALAVPQAQADALRPWLAALFLQQTLATKLGFDPSRQEIAYFYRLAKSRGISITPLRTTEEELQRFAGLPSTLQGAWLTMVAGQLSGGNWRQHAARRYARIVSAWCSGDTETLTHLLLQEFHGHDDLYLALVTDRNQDWLQSLRAKLSSAGPPVFVVVGAGHLVGPGNLVSALQQAGYRVTRP